MISKAKSCTGTTALFNYVVNEKKGYELFRNGLSGISPKEMHTEMSILQHQNSRCINDTISIVLSPTIYDSATILKKGLEALTRDLLKEMSLDPKANQFIAFVHTERAHKHVHILMNRVRPDGGMIKDSFISKKAQAAAHKIAIQHGLTSARDLRTEKERKQKNAHKEIKTIIKKAHYQVLMTKSKNLAAYQAAMARHGIQVLPTINKQGNIQGFRFIHDATGLNLKASEVDRSLKLNELFTRDAGDSKQVMEHGQLLQLHSLNTEKLGSLLSHLFNYVDESQDENTKRKRRRNSRNL